MDRRSFLQNLTICSLLTVVEPAAVFVSRPALAGPILDRAFEARGEAEVLQALFGVERSQPCDRVVLEAPFMSAPGMGARIKVHSDRPAAHAIAVTISEADYPLAAIVRLQGARCFFCTDLRLERSSTVSAHVLTNDGLFSAARTIKVTRGGYGMHTD